ncbi:MAG TPA: PAS domain S-box protein, partial [Kofleriaceae bacterium]|nr:PAS domain S-box protein [Kofleriaceae bacterium]
MIEYSSTLLDALFENNPQPCFVFERQSLRIVAANPAACALYGWPREEMLQLTLREIRPSEDLPRMEHLVAQRRDVPGNFTRMSRHRARDGRVFDVEIDIRRVMFDGVPCSLCVVAELSAASEANRRARLLIEA